MSESVAMRKYLSWINSPHVAQTAKKELRSMIGRPDEIEDCFREDLDFGTAGLRAVMALGSAKMNVYTVALAARALAECVSEDGCEDRGIVISYDSRNCSREFAEMSARIAAAVGVAVYLSDALRPVPVLSFAVRRFGAAAGVMVTASHNPPEYNGFKVYAGDGGQISSELAGRIRGKFVDVSDIFYDVSQLSELEELVECGRVRYFGEEIDDEFNSYVCSSVIGREIAQSVRENVRIVYTPLNGSGGEPVRRALYDLGYAKLLAVPEQERPDGDFPSLRVPNPECVDTFDLAVKYAGMSMADLIIATDPDADRLGVALPDGRGGYAVLTGNQIGILLMEYILSFKYVSGTLPENAFCCTSIVSSGLADKICETYGVKLYKTLTGSKHIAEMIGRLDENGDERFIFAFEEGHGYMFGGDIRDKDAVTAAVAIAEMAAISKSHGRRLYDQFSSIYGIYGYAAERSASVTRAGVNGSREISAVMDGFRSLGGRLGEEGTELGDVPVSSMRDYRPESDVLYYELEGEDWLAMRPSGTEPKLKVYVGCYGKDERETSHRADELMAKTMKEIDSRLEESCK